MKTQKNLWDKLFLFYLLIVYSFSSAVAFVIVLLDIFEKFYFKIPDTIVSLFVIVVIILVLFYVIYHLLKNLLERSSRKEIFLRNAILMFFLLISTYFLKFDQGILAFILFFCFTTFFVFFESIKKYL